MADFELLERIIKSHSTLFGQSSVTDVSVLETTNFNLIFYFQSSGKQYVLKVMKKGARSEFSILQEAEKHITVPKALSYGTIDEDAYILLERVPGKNAQIQLLSMDKAARDKFTHDSAVILAKLHRSSSNINKPDRLETSRLLSSADVAHRFEELGMQSWPGTSALAAMEPSVEPSHICLVHGRYTPSNIMLDKSGITGIVDWAESCWDSPFFDLGLTLFVFNTTGLNAALFLRSYKEEWGKPVLTDLNTRRTSMLPEGILENLPFYETLAAIEFYAMGLYASKNPRLSEILHEPTYAWALKAVAAGERVAEKLAG